MFVKILRRQSTHIQRETLYECGHYDIHHLENKIEIEMRECPVSMGKQTITISLEKKDLSVYFMNSSGGTIDSLHFNREKVKSGSYNR